MFNRNVPASTWGSPLVFSVCIFLWVYLFCLWFLLDTSADRWLGDSCKHRLPLSLTHPVSSSSNTHLLFFIPMKQQNVQNLFFPCNCSSLCCAIADFFHCTTSMDLIVVKNRSSLFLFAHFSSSPLRWVYLIAFCGPEVSTFMPCCFRPENAYIRVKSVMWDRSVTSFFDDCPLYCCPFFTHCLKSKYL